MRRIKNNIIDEKIITSYQTNQTNYGRVEENNKETKITKIMNKIKKYAGHFEKPILRRNSLYQNSEESKRT